MAGSTVGCEGYYRLTARAPPMPFGLEQGRASLQEDNGPLHIGSSVGRGNIRGRGPSGDRWRNLGETAMRGGQFCCSIDTEALHVLHLDLRYP